MNKQNPKTELERVSLKLDILIGLLYDLNDILTSKSSIRQKVAYLSSRKLSNKEISQVLGISDKHVSKEKSLLNEK